MLRSGRVWSALVRSADRYFEKNCVAGIATKLELRGEEPAEKWPERFVPPFEAREFTPASRRTGAIAIKVGMTQDWDSYGAMLPLTVLWLDCCEVIQVKHIYPDGVTSMQLGCGHRRWKRISADAQEDQDRPLGLTKSKLAEFRVSYDALLPVGTEITAAHFKPGQYVDITGTTIGKGFQGVMKKYGFKGGSASHGNSKAHRLAGSTGMCQDPGKVLKGKKLPGQMGADRRTVLNSWVYKVDPARNLIYVKGQVPGHKGSYVLVKDAHRKKNHDLPFPTFIGDLPETSIATPPMDPYHTYGDE
ncbi:hypothetical protein BSKO_10365 [Bryopsis sp. KO-2023]|nr:hypothetical protein BSKO_10365 [Bryopsis sp. KO-2023]